MGSGSRARSRGINPKDNFLVETSHRAVVPAGSPRAEISSVRVDISDANESGAWCRACAASTTNPRPVHLPPTPNDSSAVGRAVSRATVSYDAAACRACGRGNASSGAGSPSTSPPSPLAKSAEYLLERYAERRALGGSAQTSRGGDVRSVGDLVGGNRGVAPVDEAPVGDGLELGHENATKPSHTKQTCDACAACADTCGVVGCGTCGGPVQLANETSASSPHFGDVELADNERGVSLEAAAAAAAGAAAAAANPRREGWGRDASSVFAVNDDDDDDTSASSTGTKHARQFTCCEVHRRRKNGQSLLVAQGFVYDASLFLMDHPVGPLPILRAVNRDNTQDMQMHSAAAQRVWHKLRVGVLKLCPANGFGEFKPPKSETRCVVM